MQPKLPTEEEFPNGTLYLIICKASELSLRIENTQSHKDSRITGAAPNPQDLSQLWFVNRTKDTAFEIVNALSDFCFDEQKGEFRMAKPKWSASQLIHIERSPIQEYYQYYWIKLVGTYRATKLEGILRCREFDMNDPTFLFRFEPVDNNNNILNKTTFIENPLALKVLDVPEASMEGGVRLIQWKRNGRFNQRWTFIKTGNAYQIRSFKSGLNLDINQESKKPGAKIIQWDPTGSSNQLWALQNRGKDIYVIRSVHAPDLYLGIEGDSRQDGGKAVTTASEFFWRLDGMMFK